VPCRQASHGELRNFGTGRLGERLLWLRYPLPCGESPAWPGCGRRPTATAAANGKRQRAAAPLIFGVAVWVAFHTVRRRPGRTDQRRWSSLNRSGRRPPELLMRLGLACRYQGQQSLTDFSRTDRTVPDYGVSAGHPAGR